MIKIQPNIWFIIHTKSVFAEESSLCDFAKISLAALLSIYSIGTASSAMI